MTSAGSHDTVQALRELRASEGRYRQLIRHIPIPLLTVDAREPGRLFQELKAEGVRDLPAYLQDHPELVQIVNTRTIVTDANDEAQALFGSDREALIGPVEYIFRATPAAAVRVMTAWFEGRSSYHEEMRLRTKSGEIRDVLLMVTYPDANEPLDASLVLMIDVTSRLHAEERVRQLEMDVRQASRTALLGEFIASVAHDIKQPLAAIMTNGQTSLRWLSHEDPNLPKVGQLAERIVESARDANQILQRLQDIAGPHNRRWEPLDLNQVAREAVVIVRRDLEGGTTELTLVCEDGSLWTVGDRVQLQQVIVTMLVTRIVVMQDAKCAQPAMTLSVTSDDRDLVVRLSDSGPGVAGAQPESNLEELFARDAEGLAIGLGVCRSIAEAHGGTLQSCAPPRGSELVLRLPAAPGGRSRS